MKYKYKIRNNDNYKTEIMLNWNGKTFGKILDLLKGFLFYEQTTYTPEKPQKLKNMKPNDYII